MSSALARMNRLVAVGALAAVAALVAIVMGQAGAAAPPGPRVAFAMWKLTKPMEVRLESVDANGLGRRTLAGKGRIWPAIFDGGSWLPDGSAIAFAGAPRKARSKSNHRIYLVAADGSGPRPIPGTRGAGEPLVSPDGTTLAFTRTKLKEPKIDLKPPFDIPPVSGGYFSTTTWIIDLPSGKARRLTPWRNYLTASPTSFSPDGKTLVLDRDKPGDGGPEVVMHELASGRESVFARGAEEAVFSPDGTRLAMVSYRDGLRVDTGDGPVSVGELYVVNADGSAWHRLSHTADRQEAGPSWDPSGQRLAFTRDSGPEWLSLGTTNVVMAVNADGSCSTVIFGSRRAAGAQGPGLYEPSWQPGPGREAGPIVC